MYVCVCVCVCVCITSRAHQLNFSFSRIGPPGVLPHTQSRSGPTPSRNPEQRLTRGTWAAKRTCARARCACRTGGRRVPLSAHAHTHTHTFFPGQSSCHGECTNVSMYERMFGRLECIHRHTHVCCRAKPASGGAGAWLASRRRKKWAEAISHAFTLTHIHTRTRARPSESRSAPDNDLKARGW